MDSARSYRAASVKIRRFIIREDEQELTEEQNTLNTAVEGNAKDPENAEESAEEKAQQAAEELQDWQSRLQAANTGVVVRSSASQTLFNLRQTTIRYIFDILFGARRNRLTQWMEDNGIPTVGSRDTYSTQGQQYISSTKYAAYSQQFNVGTYNADTLKKGVRALDTKMKVLSYSEETLEVEREDTAFSTVGTVRTADGREINFNVNVGMSRQFQQQFSEDLQLASFTMCDPLVINLDTDVAELSDQTFYFDIDADGEQDEVSQLGAGSGYLALDKNGDGRINDGSELFGTASGDGFADLAKYDEDGNGWIDENDQIWDKLKIWCKDKDGNDVLYRLADKGVGAICLQNVSTDHTMKGQEGQTKGAVRNTGVFLYENGNVGTVQHVDVAKYYAQA